MASDEQSADLSDTNVNTQDNPAENETKEDSATENANQSEPGAGEVQNMKERSPLPPGWKELTDAKNRLYYWNTKTNEVTWTRPVMDPGASEATPAPQAPKIAKYQRGTLDLSRFEVGPTLGTGAYGRVCLCRDKENGQYVALKMLNKFEVVAMKQIHHIKQERAILSNIAHPFIVNLLGYFQDDFYLYFVLDYVPGGELFTLLRRRKRFSNDVSVFYAGQIVLAFEYLHSMDYAYRDLKPENLLIDRDGYLKITDFGFAKHVPDGTRTHTVCGTPEYLAPEIIQNRGHSTACDWWALGVLIYEMLCGYPPFESETQYGIYKKVIAANITFPKIVSDAAKDLIEKLLNPRPAYRLGNLKGGAADIRNHEWFKDLDWQGLHNKRFRAPFVPKVKSDSDTSNFQKYEERTAAEIRPVEREMFDDFDS
eukprot:c16293_g2_i1.p1 GENE.c16293_g2_i1~~c16293_g2_i1.p1  ORF type:complete len:425 (-),score=103.01 c16293_g2_i1:251-1525(-)